MIVSPPNEMESHSEVYHFKWIKGLAEKLARRAKTEEYTEGQYKDLGAGAMSVHVQSRQVKTLTSHNHIMMWTCSKGEPLV